MDLDFGQVSQYFLNGKFSPQITRGGVVLVAQRHTHTQNQNFTAIPLELTPDFSTFLFPCGAFTLDVKCKSRWHPRWHPMLNGR
jgi:hypothetical protein